MSNERHERESDSRERRTRSGDPKRRTVLRSLGLSVGIAGMPMLGRNSRATLTDGADDVSCATGPFERVFEPKPRDTSEVGFERDVEAAIDGSLDLSDRSAVRRTIREQLSTRGLDVSKEQLPLSFESGLEDEPKLDRVIENAREKGLDATETARSTNVHATDTPGQQLSVLTEFPGPVDPLNIPSDANIAAGPNDLVSAVNTLCVIYDKGGRARDAFSLEEWFANVISEDQFLFGVPFVSDPWVRYDPDRGCFYLLATYYNFLENVGYSLLSVSDDRDPTGRWYNYAIKPIDPSGVVDYPKLGFDGDAVYLTQNFFDDYLFFDQVELTILDKDALAEGRPVSASIFQDLRNPDGSKAYTVLPADQPLLDAEASQTRPFFMLNAEFGLDFSDLSSVGSGSGLTLWEVRDPLEDPTLDCRRISVPPYSLAPPAEQPGTDALLDVGLTRLINLVYDENDDTLWTAHVAAQDWNSDGDLVSAIRWYEVDPFERTVVQRGVWGEPGEYYGFPTLNVNEDSMMMTYSVVGPETFARMDVAGRTDDYTSGQIEDSVVIREGESPYVVFEDDPVQRWGDYWGVSVDPETGRFWNIAQYSTDIDFDDDFDLYATQIAETTFESEEGE